MTIARFKSHNKMLWNAKMRFGKTLSTLEVIKRKNFKKTIILTHRPVVDEGWHKDFTKIFWDQHYFYCEKGTDESHIVKHIKNGDSFIYFASIQDLRGSDKVGGRFVKNKVIYETNWDLVVVDEAHEGTKTSLGDEVLRQIIKEESYGKTKQIYLSGTPFNLVEDFEDDEVYTWDYVMEQKAKAEWDTIHGLDSNPYEGLPKLGIFTYDISDAIPNYEDIEDKAFNFREFFRVWTGTVENDGCRVPPDSEPGRFVHENDVKSFLNLLCKKDDDSNYPFSRDEYRNYFNHTLWMLPGVKEAKALEALLVKHNVFGFGNFKIVNVAGEVLSATKDPLERVTNAITSHPEETRTITLSCGRLTTGVTVKPWTAVLMLYGSGATSASSYLQTIFRVQTPANINGRMKDRCFVFDFAPDRTLQMIAEAGKLGTRPGSNDSASEDKMREFLNFCPVIAIQGSEMHTYDVNSMLRQLKKYYAARVAQNGFDDVKLYNDNLLKLTDLDKAKFEELKKIVGASKAADIQKKIVISESGLGPEEQAAAEDAAKKKKQKKKLTEKELEALKKYEEAKEAKSKAISILRAISIRIPLLVYGSEKDIDEDITIDSFADMVDDISWNEFMPCKITKSKFNEFKQFYDKDIFIEAGNQIRRKVKAADGLNPTERVKKLAQIFATFKNPDKETVLTPWRVVNMHMSDCLGGYDFYDEKHVLMQEKPRYVDRGEVTEKTFANTDARILEINSKSGLYPLYVTYSIYRKRLDAYKEDERTMELQDKLWRQTIVENVFVVCKTEMSKYITKRTLLGYKPGKINAHYFEDLVNQFKNKSDQVVKKISSKSYWNVEGTGNMKFDAIVGNPPYQEMDGGNAASAIPIYHFFVLQAKKLKPSFISMVMPSRWFSGGRGLDSFRKEMLTDERLSCIHDFPNSSDCFTGVEIKGGVCYFLWDSNHKGFCKVASHKWGQVSYSERPLLEDGMSIFLRDDIQVSVLQKVLAFEEQSISTILNPGRYFGFHTKINRNDDSTGSIQTADGKSFIPISFSKTKEKPIKIYIHGGECWVSSNDIPKNEKDIGKFKILLPRSGNPKSTIIGYPKISEPGSCSSNTYVVALFPNKVMNENETANLVSYMKTRFFRYLVKIKSSTQDLSPEAYSYVPIQDFSKPWTDEELYDKYGLSQEEIDFIDSMIKPMN